MARYAAIGDAIRQAVKQDTRSPCAIASAAGVDRGVLSRYLRGERDVTTETADKLCRVLGLELQLMRPAHK